MHSLHFSDSVTICLKINMKWDSIWYYKYRNSFSFKSIVSCILCVCFSGCVDGWKEGRFVQGTGRKIPESNSRHKPTNYVIHNSNVIAINYLVKKILIHSWRNSISAKDRRVKMISIFVSFYLIILYCPLLVYIILVRLEWYGSRAISVDWFLNRSSLLPIVADKFVVSHFPEIMSINE